MWTLRKIGILRENFQQRYQSCIPLAGRKFSRNTFPEKKFFFRYQAKICRHIGLEVSAVMLEIFSNRPISRVDYKEHFEKKINSKTFSYIVKPTKSLSSFQAYFFNHCNKSAKRD